MSVNLGKQRLVIIGFLAVLLVAIPATIFLLKGTTGGGSSRAAPSTVLSLTTTQAQVAPGDSVAVNVVANPGTNAISVIQLSISYDSTKLSTASGGFAPNTTSFPTTLNPVTYGPCTGNFCTITTTLAIGADPTKAITTKTTVGTITFQALAATDQGPTTVSFGTDTTVFSVGSTDQANENVLSSTQPLSLTIASGASLTGTPTGTASATLTLSPTVTLIADNTSSTTATLTPTTTSGQVPVCTALSVDQATASSGATLNFTANGNSPNGVISKVTFNFGDASVQDVTSGGGIGTNNVSVQQAHSYTTDGIYTATAVMTDDSNNTTASSECQQTVTIGAVSITTTPVPTLSGLPLTGPGDKFIGIGLGGAVVAIIGGFLLFGL